MAVQQTVLYASRRDRVLRFAFEWRAKREKHLILGPPINGIIHTMPFWDECLRAMAAEYPDIRTDQISHRHSYSSFRPPSDWFDVVCGLQFWETCFPTLVLAVGSARIGLAPIPQISSGKEYPSCEPSMVRLPISREEGIANPLGQIWSGAMMLRHLEIPDAADAVENAIAAVLAEAKVSTPDIGGIAATGDLGEAMQIRFGGT